MNNKQILWNSKHGLTLLVISLMFATGRSLPAQMDAGESPAQMFPTNPLFDVKVMGVLTWEMLIVFRNRVLFRWL